MMFSFPHLIRSHRKLKGTELRAPRILLIDDDIMFSKIMAAFAKNENVVFSWWNTFQNKLTPQLRKIDVVILDYELENITGLQFANQLAEYLNGTPVLMVSAYSRLETSKWPKIVSGFVSKEKGPQEILRTALALYRKKSQTLLKNTELNSSSE